MLAAIVETGVDAHWCISAPWASTATAGPGAPIPEGYLRSRCDARGRVEQEILYPANPGSIYHMTKTQDQLMFAFYNKNDGVRITDLHQGIVWGTQTGRPARTSG